MTPQTAIAPPDTALDVDEAVVTFWDIAKKQFSKNKPAVFALWAVIALILLAMTAPLIALNIPYAMSTDDGIIFPLFDALFNRLIFPSGVDVFFNLLLLIGPTWWLTGRALRRSPIEGQPASSAPFLWNAIPAGLLLAAMGALAMSTRGIYGWIALVCVVGIAGMVRQSMRIPTMLPRHVRPMRTNTRFALACCSSSRSC